MDNIINLTKVYPCSVGGISIKKVDCTIFVKRYYSECMTNSTCNDWCCSHGVDIDVENVRRLRHHVAELEPLVGVPSDKWFTDEVKSDSDFPGGSFRRTRIFDGKCVFRNNRGRGCWIHEYCIRNNLDFHLLKPIVSSLFPLTFNEGLLLPSIEVTQDSLVCSCPQSTLYRGVRGELKYYFGERLLSELDMLEQIYNDRIQ